MKLLYMDYYLFLRLSKWYQMIDRELGRRRCCCCSHCCCSHYRHCCCCRSHWTRCSNCWRSVKKFTIFPILSLYIPLFFPRISLFYLLAIICFLFWPPLAVARGTPFPNYLLRKSSLPSPRKARACWNVISLVFTLTYDIWIFWCSCSR